MNIALTHDLTSDINVDAAKVRNFYIITKDIYEK
jgi:hypothetical protein